MYKVKITRVEIRKSMETEYKKIADTGNEKDGGAIYGYVENPQEVKEEQEILSQEVSEIDLFAVIKAVNKIS